MRWLSYVVIHVFFSRRLISWSSPHSGVFAFLRVHRFASTFRLTRQNLFCSRCTQWCFFLTIGIFHLIVLWFGLSGRLRRVAHWFFSMYINQPWCFVRQFHFLCECPLGVIIFNFFSTLNLSPRFLLFPHTPRPACTMHPKAFIHQMGIGFGEKPEPDGVVFSWPSGAMFITSDYHHFPQFYSLNVWPFQWLRFLVILICAMACCVLAAYDSLFDTRVSNRHCICALISDFWLGVILLHCVSSDAFFASTGICSPMHACLPELFYVFPVLMFSKVYIITRRTLHLLRYKSGKWTAHSYLHKCGMPGRFIFESIFLFVESPVDLRSPSRPSTHWSGALCLFPLVCPPSCPVSFIQRKPTQSWWGFAYSLLTVGSMFFGYFSTLIGDCSWLNDISKQTTSQMKSTTPERISLKTPTHSTYKWMYLNEHTTFGTHVLRMTRWRGHRRRATVRPSDCRAFGREGSNRTHYLESRRDSHRR